MHSILIRYTSSDHADSFRKGNLYMSSLSKFWDIQKGQKDPIPLLESNNFDKSKQYDLHEGVGVVIPLENAPEFIRGDFGDDLRGNVRFRVDAYANTNLLCFYRIDIDDYPVSEQHYCDEQNLLKLLSEKGVHATEEELVANPNHIQQLYYDRYRNNYLSSTQCHVIQLPGTAMDRFGDSVIIIKDTEEFCGRVVEAVKAKGGDAVLGNVRYRSIFNEVPKDSELYGTVSVLTGDPLDGSEYLNNPAYKHYGPLDKYDIYDFQKEWRVCWLPKEWNGEPKTLQVGSLEDIVDIVSTEEFRSYLIDHYAKGYIPGIVNNDSKQVTGTCSYSEFKNKVESISSMGTFLVDTDLEYLSKVQVHHQGE